MISYDQSLFRMDVCIPFDDLSMEWKKMVDIIILVSLGGKKGEADHDPEKQLSSNNNFFHT